MFGFCKLRQDFRLFRLTRIVDLQQTDQLFEPREIPEDKLQFDSHFQEMKHVTLLVDSSLEYQLIDLTGVDSYEKQADGRLIIHYPYETLEYVLQLILGFGDKAKVLAPEFMIEELKLRLQSIMNRYL
jgi:predicted DNA-binding transcriptional regulator YafY